MQQRCSRALLTAAVASALVVAACGGGSAEPSATTAQTAPAEGTPVEATPSETTPGAAPLAGICPETIVIQTDWMPEAEHGFLYNLVGEGFEMDASKAYVTGPLVAAGVDTGVTIQIRSGGLPQQFSPVTQIMYNDPDVLAGFVYTDEAIQFSGSEFPTVAVMSGFEKNPQMIMWDPNTYPDVTGIADLGELGVAIRYFGGMAYMDYLTGSGILSTEQIDGSYTGDPSLFVADEGKAAQQGFGSAEPYAYEVEIAEWGKPVKYQYINDIGWRNYAQSIATRPANLEKYHDCFTALVPMIQQSSVDFLTDPSHATSVILAAVEAFGGDFGWAYSQGNADFGVQAILADGLQANGTDGVMGSFDLDRVAGLIEIAVPIYAANGATPKEGLVPEDIVTNEFIDTSIGL